ncbi:MAG: DUF4160 domain-containing protein [Bacteroidales bacterium]|nr:DUF4160 domain-containing protein [Bacteroidales bacterium]
MPEISRFYGIVITMFINEHSPPHFHIRYDNYRAIIEIENGKITGQLPPRAMRLVLEWLNLHKAELFENWELLRNGKQSKRIKPLE